MTSVSCIVITTLVVVSLANLVLLVHVIMHSMSKCDKPTTKRIPKLQKRDSSVQVPSPAFKFLASLTLSDEFVCGAAVISKKWVLTASICAQVVLDEPKETLKVNVGEVRHDVEKIVVGDVGLVSTTQSFKAKDVASVPLPTKNFRYVAQSNATALGWNKEFLPYSVATKLLIRQQCQDNYNTGDAAFCAERKVCSVDSAEFLMQRDLLIGVVAFPIDCDKKPVIYRKIAFAEEWIRRNKIGAVFKGSAQ